jgi:16S rRNA pseudouridine516 synthase
MADRLDAFLAHRGFGTRSQVRSLVKSGVVALNGVVCRDQAARVEGRAVSVQGRVVEVGASEATLLFHKPIGYACSNDPSESPLIGELVPREFAHLGLQGAGRLDRDTSGLLVLSTDGELIHSLTNPRRHVLKRYRVSYRGRLSHHAVARCSKGIRLPDDPKPTLPAVLEVHEAGADGLGRCTLHLSEGRHHQVRRMIHELGGEVVSLHRDRIGMLELPGDLGPGAMRALAEDERVTLMGEPDDVPEPSAHDAHHEPEAAAAPEPPPSMIEILRARRRPGGARKDGPGRGPKGPAAR